MTKQHVYVDTSIYKQYKFDFIKNPLQQLTDKQLFVNLCSDITKREILKHHAEMLEKDVAFKCPDNFLHLLRKKHNITPSPDVDINELLSLSIDIINKTDKVASKSIDDMLVNSIKNHKYKEDELITQTILDNQGIIIPPYYQNSVYRAIDFLINSMKLQSKKHLQDYLDNECEFVDCYKVDPKLIFDAHFNSQPPFTNPKKPNEFKDAYVLFSLLEYAKENKATISIISVVSGDADWKKFVNYADNNKYLIHYENLPAFLYREEISYLIAKQYIEELIKYANSNIEDFIDMHPNEYDYLLEEDDSSNNSVVAFWEIDRVSYNPNDITYHKERNSYTFFATIHIDINNYFYSSGCDSAHIIEIVFNNKNKISKVECHSFGNIMRYFIDTYNEASLNYQRGK